VVERADHLRRLLGERVERTASHLDPVPVALGRESLAVEELDDRRVRLGLLQVPAPARSGLVRARLAVWVPRESVREHGGEEPVVVVPARDSLARQPVDDARAPAPVPPLGSLLDEP